ncbi:MAG: hypothetical protein AAGI01_01160, partial [Myxococcota bacterium]
TAPDIELEPGTCPEGLRHIVNKMLRKDPERRYQDANAALADVRNLTKVPPPDYSGQWPYEGTPAPMQAPTFTHSDSARALGNKTNAVIILAALILLLSGVGVITTAFLSDTPANTEDTLATSAADDPADGDPAASTTDPDDMEQAEDSAPSAQSDIEKPATSAAPQEEQSEDDKKNEAPTAHKEHPPEPKKRRRAQRRKRTPRKDKPRTTPPLVNTPAQQPAPKALKPPSEPVKTSESPPKPAPVRSLSPKAGPILFETVE